MSAETLKAIADAIQAHFADAYGDGAVVTDWFVAYGGMRLDAGQLVHTRSHATSDTSPFGVYGVASLCVDDLGASLTDEQ